MTLAPAGDGGIAAALFELVTSTTSHAATSNQHHSTAGTNWASVLIGVVIGVVVGAVVGIYIGRRSGAQVSRSPAPADLARYKPPASQRAPFGWRRRPR